MSHLRSPTPTHVPTHSNVLEVPSPFSKTNLHNPSPNPPPACATPLDCFDSVVAGSPNMNREQVLEDDSDSSLVPTGMIFHDKIKKHVAEDFKKLGNLLEKSKEHHHSFSFNDYKNEMIRKSLDKEKKGNKYKDV